MNSGFCFITFIWRRSSDDKDDVIGKKKKFFSRKLFFRTSREKEVAFH